MRNIVTKSAGIALIFPLLLGCQSNGDKYQSNVYTSGQVNTKQEAQTINILAVLPAKIEVDNSQQKKAASIFGAVVGGLAGAALGHSLGDQSTTNTLVGAAGGGVAGATAGSLVSDTTLVDGVSIAYDFEGKTYNSAQVGKLCEFTPGRAIVISSAENETRIQPNATCPTASN